MADTDNTGDWVRLLHDVPSELSGTKKLQPFCAALNWPAYMEIKPLEDFCMCNVQICVTQNRSFVKKVGWKNPPKR